MSDIFHWSVNTALDAVIGHSMCDVYDECDDCPMHYIEEDSEYSCSSIAEKAAKFLAEWKGNLPEGTILENLTLEDLI